MAAVLPCDHHRLGHLGVAHQRRLDLAQLDAEAADLDLMVGASQVLQRPVGAPAGHVPGAVHPGARFTERIGHEPLGRQAGPAQVAAGQLHTGDVELAGNTDRRR